VDRNLHSKYATAGLNPELCSQPSGVCTTTLLRFEVGRVLGQKFVVRSEIRGQKFVVEIRGQTGLALYEKSNPMAAGRFHVYRPQF
jgi:hypothetical protein